MTFPSRIFCCIDMDAYYAQAESRRLGFSDSVPLAVQQWTNLIAVNYEARKFGISRFTNADEAKKLCSKIRLPHVDTYKLNDKGEVERSTIEDKFKKHDRLNEKINLDHYRSESKKIFQIIKQDYKTVEIASIDEVFIDITPEIEAFKSNPSASASLPPLCSKILLASDQSFSPCQIENRDFLIADYLISQTRSRIFQTYHYTCSAGLSFNKMLAKLASGINKPNGQTLILPDLLPFCLYHFPIGKLRGFGGLVSSKFEKIGVKTIEDAMTVSREEVRRLFGDNGDYVFERVRGYDEEEVGGKKEGGGGGDGGGGEGEGGRKNKSILSSKSMWRRPARGEEELEGSLEVIAIDLYTRMMGYFEESELLPVSLSMNYFDNGDMGGGEGGGRVREGREGKIEGRKEEENEGEEERKESVGRYRSGGYRSKTIGLDLTGREEDFKGKIDRGMRELVNMVKKDIFPCHSIGFTLKNFKSKRGGYKFNLLDYWKRKDEGVKKDEGILQKKERDSKAINEELNENLKLDKEKERGERGINNAREEGLDEKMGQIKGGGKENIEEEMKELTKCGKCGELVGEKEMASHLDFHFACEIDREVNPNKRKYKMMNKVKEEEETLKRSKKENLDFFVIKKGNEGKNEGKKII